jgi:beta-galactosidase
LFRTSFKPYASQRTNGGTILLESVTGKAEIWLDNKLVVTKSTFEKEDINVPMPPSATSRTLTVLIEAEKGKKAGIGGVVKVK